MGLLKKVALLLLSITMLSSCVSKKKLEALSATHKSEMDVANVQLGKLGEELSLSMKKLSACEQDRIKLESAASTNKKELSLRKEQIDDLKNQVKDVKSVRDKQVSQVGDLTVLTQSANANMKETLEQLKQKNKYVEFLQKARSRADSINLALGFNLKSVLKEGLEDKDVDIKVDKTVVFINLSDKMLYESGSSNLTSRANEVLGKIAKIIESRPNLEVMVEGYTDNVPINSSCVKDNWDLSVKRATSVIRVLQNTYNIDPNRLIAAGRGEYNVLASNNTATGRSMNRRTRIIILPKLNEFYELLNPNNMPK